MLITLEEATKIYKEANKIATIHHEGIFRKDNKTPYITHPLAVDYIVDGWFEKKINFKLFYSDLPEFKRYFDILSPESREALRLFLKSVAQLHDVLEDEDKNGNTYSFNKLSKLSSYLAVNVSDLTRYESESYLSFLLRLKPNPIARYVKLGDLEHNLSDLKPGSLRDKYIMAQHILLA